MTFKNISVIHVYYLGDLEKKFMGRLAANDQKIYFEYDREFLTTGLNLSPFKLPLKSGVTFSEDNVFNGLFGIFNDSLPDGWGRLLLDRKLAKQGINPLQLSPLDRLCYVGNHGMGALAYEPTTEEIKPLSHEPLDKIAIEISQFQENDGDQFVDDLFAMSGSSAGARPKIVVNMNKKDWIIKFRSSMDDKDIGSIEYAYHLMAKAAGLKVPFAQLFPSKKVSGFFGVERFDRINGKRIHVHTVSGLLHADYRLPALDYATIMKATLWLTKNIKECEKQFRHAVFNVLAHNRDDHAKNFSFLMDEKGQWSVSPAYDLVFSSGPFGEHCTMVMGEGKNPTMIHFLKLAEIAGIKEHKAMQIVDEVKSAVAKWGKFAEEAGVSKASNKKIRTALDKIARAI